MIKKISCIILFWFLAIFCSYMVGGWWSALSTAFAIWCIAGVVELVVNE